MLRIYPKIVKHNGIYCYESRLFTGRKVHDIRDNYTNLKIRNTKLQINDMKVDKNIAKRFYQFLNHQSNATYYCYNFANHVLPTGKHYQRWVSTGELDILKPFDRLDLFKFVNAVYADPNHICIYIGRHFNNTYNEQYLFLSKLGGMGIYVHSMEQLLSIYESTSRHILLRRFL
jgi:hypothetical protein